jgi:cell wall-associated NlpC family hydrolase
VALLYPSRWATRAALLAPGAIGVVILSLTAAQLGPSWAANTNVNLCGALPVGARLPDGSALNSAQAANASIIVGFVEQAGGGNAGAVDAVTAAFTESRLVNVDGGDRDSLGLFQERPSQGWGTPAEIMNPVYATAQFFVRLAALPGWQSLSPATAAQDVERSAYPGRYQEWVGPATELVAGLSGTGACTNAASGLTALPNGAAGLPSGFALPAGTPMPVVTAIDFAVAQLGKPYVWGGVGPAGFDCSGLVMEAYLSAGISLPRTTYAQVYSGQPVYNPSQLEPGDLLFIEGSDPGPGGAPGHVGMYIGAGLVIDAPHTGATVEVTELAGWINQIVAIRRIVPY